MIRFVLIAALVVVTGCKSEDKGGGPGGGGPRKGPTQFPVEVQPVESRDVEYAVTAVGSLEAFEVVQVTARVAGAVEKVSFREGDTVKQGQTLVEIEPSRYLLAVRTARAQVAKAQAAKADAQAGLDRRAAVNETNPGLIRGEELETFRTRALTADAELSAAKAALEEAELNLRDAYVRAPVAGVIQSRSVQTGQYVQPGSVLATLIQRDPLLLRFQISETDAQSVKKGMAATFKVRGNQTPFTAVISHVADVADVKSRLVAVTAEVNDPKKADLRPGSFTEVSVPVGGVRASPVIPQTAIRPSERGFLAFVVEGDKAKERVVQLGLRTEDGRVEVRGGIQVGEQLVVRGAEALRDGVSVKVSGNVGGSGPPKKKPDEGVR